MDLPKIHVKVRDALHADAKMNKQSEYALKNTEDTLAKKLIQT